MITLRPFLFFPAVLLAGLTLHAQVEVDKKINLTGAQDSDRAITNLAAPVNGTDAANKDYVDAAVSASGGATVSMLSAESVTSMNLGNAARYCFNLTETVDNVSYNDWHLPNADEMMRVFSGGVSVPSNSSSNYFWLANYDNTQRLNYYGSYGIAFRMSDGSFISNPTTTSYYARCVR